MKHYDVLIKYRKGSLNVVIEKKELVDFINRYYKGAREIIVKEVYIEED